MTYKYVQKAHRIKGKSNVLVWLPNHSHLDWNNPNIYLYTQSKKETRIQKIDL